MNAKVSLVKCNSYEPQALQEALSYALTLLGGITNFINPNSRVLVKPNLLMPKGPEYAITTHPQVVRAVICLLKEINCKITVGDGPSVWGNYIENVDEVYELTGIKQVCHEEGVRLVNFDKRRMRDKFPLTLELDECDHLVNLPKLKTHQLTLMTGAIKNLFGLVSGTYKTELHKNYFAPDEFAKVLVDIYQQAKPSLTIIDGILAMEGDGPATGGKPRQLGLLLAGSDCVALDTVAAKVMGITQEEVLTTKEAAMRNLGQGQLDKIEIVGEQIDRLNIRPFVLPNSVAKISKGLFIVKRLLGPLFKGLVKYYPFSLYLKCTHCGRCVKVCPKQCIRLDKKGIKVDYRKCIACFCCQETCPAAAIGVKKSLLTKLIGL